MRYFFLTFTAFGLACAPAWSQAVVPAMSPVGVDFARIEKGLTGPSAAKHLQDIPTQSELDAVSVDLPYLVMNPNQVFRNRHIVFVDVSGHGGMASYHTPLWRRQAEVLRARLRSAGVSEGRIHVHGLVGGGDPAGLLSLVRSYAGPKSLYFFGHAGPFSIFTGHRSVNVTAILQGLLAAEVWEITNYGCSFVAPGAAEVRAIQATLPRGRTLSLLGHERPSTKTDDSPLDRGNPIVQLTISRDGARTLNLPAAIDSLHPSRLLRQMNPLGR